jgi:asparagine synthase (glutamine-hydrolysing)
MCGLSGIIGLNGAPVDPGAVARMSAILRHRGPDDEGTFLLDSVGLGFRRLAILDLSPAGHQPMLSPCGDVVIVFNGEIYNYVELRRELESLGHRFRSTGDTEVLLHAYMEWGDECLGRFNGMWAFLIVDRRRKIVFGARDRFGKSHIRVAFAWRSSDTSEPGTVRRLGGRGHLVAGCFCRRAVRFALWKPAGPL